MASRYSPHAKEPCGANETTHVVLGIVLGEQISMPWDDTVTLTQKLLGQDGVQPAGLGARDSLRLEAGLCLYGHDLGPDTSPVEAALLWTIRTWCFVICCWGTVVSLLYVREKVHCATSASLRRRASLWLCVLQPRHAARQVASLAPQPSKSRYKANAITAPCSTSSSKSLSHTLTNPTRSRKALLASVLACW